MALKDKIVKIAYELKDKFSGRVSKITGSIRSVGSESDKTTAKLEVNNTRAGNSFDALLTRANLLKAGVIALGVGFVKLVSSAGSAVRSAGIQERAETKLATSLRNLTGATQEQTQALIDQAAVVQQATGFGDELIISAQAQLATFQLTADQIQQITPLMVDMGESQRKLGQETVDLESIALALGKAFTSGIGSLSRYGVALSDAQKEAFKLADQQGKVDIVVQALTDNFGGLATAVGDEYEGAARKADAAQGDFGETLGATVTQNKDFIDFIQRIGEGWVSLGKSVKESSAEINTAISFVFRTFKAFTGSIKVLFNFFQIAIKGSLAAINDSLALLALGLSKITFGDVSKEFKRTADSLAATSKELKESLIDDYFNDIGEGAADVVEAFTGIEQGSKALDRAANNVQSASDKTKAALDREKAAVDAAAKAHEEKSKALKQSLKDSEKALQDNIKEAKSSLDDFQQLINEIQAGPEKAAEDLTIIDFAESLTNAQQALNAGDFQGAMDGAKSTAELLRKMKDSGAESSLVLIGLAQQLQRVAAAASSGLIANGETAVAKVQKDLQALSDAGPVAKKLVLDTSEAEQQLELLEQRAAQAITKKIHVSADGASSSDGRTGTSAVFKEEALRKGRR